MAKPKKNVIGEIYGRLVITGDAPNLTKDRRVFVKCECGTTKDVLLGDLRRGDTVSCGCYLKEVITKHGDAHARLYKIFNTMHNRCYLTTLAHYDNYGGRGISVCAEWLNNYIAFREWAMANGYSDDLSIDRRDNNKGYSPDNCRWATNSTQQRNKRPLTGCSSPYIGASYCKQTGRWICIMKINGKNINLGRFDTDVEAAKARDNYILSNNLEDYTMNTFP